MKTFFKFILLLFALLPSSIAMANEDITGTWQGELQLDSGKQVTLQFLIQKNIDNAYSVVLSLPDEAGTGDIKASSVIFRSGKLTFDIPELSGSYGGVLTDGGIAGQWHQEGGSIPLDISRFELRPLPREDTEKLLGKWYGKDCPPGTIGGRGRYIFEFVLDGGKNVTGGVKVFLPSGKLDPAHYKITEMGKNGDDFIFKISSMDAEFRGKFAGNEIVGELTSLRWTRSYTITKGEYSPDLSTKSDLTDSVVEFLSGKWIGNVAVKGNEQVYQFRMLFEFEKTEAGVFKAHIIERNSFDEVNPITEVKIDGNKIKLKTEDFEVQFEMKLSGNTLTGEWIQCGISYPITIVKAEI